MQKVPLFLQAEMRRNIADVERKYDCMLTSATLLSGSAMMQYAEITVVLAG